MQFLIGVRTGYKLAAQNFRKCVLVMVWILHYTVLTPLRNVIVPGCPSSCRFSLESGVYIHLQLQTAHKQFYWQPATNIVLMPNLNLSSIIHLTYVWCDTRDHHSHHTIINTLSRGHVTNISRAMYNYYSSCIYIYIVNNHETYHVERLNKTVCLDRVSHN